MWPFKRQPKNSKQVPPEVKQYYDSEHRERVGLAWLIAFLSLIVTVLIIAGLFFGGRWVYRKIANRNHTPTTAPVGTGLEQPVQPPSSTTPSTPNSLQPAAPSQNQGNNSSSSSSNSSSGSTGTSSISTTTPSSTSTPTPTNGKITNTGPGDTAMIFIGATAVAAILYQLNLRRKLSHRL